MKILRTANLRILEIAMLGGQVSHTGDYSDDDHSFTKYNDHLKLEGSFSIDKIKDHIEFYIEEYGNNKFEYYGDFYKFKKPNYKNLLILSKRIHKILSTQEV